MKRTTWLLILAPVALAAIVMTVSAANEGASGNVATTQPAISPGMAMEQKEPEKIKGKEVKLTGKLSCTFCTLAHPDMTCKKGCCASCIKAGDPPMLTDAEGQMYILLGNEMKKPLMTPERMEMAGGKVSVKGMMVKGKGIQAIFVEKMEKVADSPEKK